MKYVPSSLIHSANNPKRDFFSRKIRDREKKVYDYKTVFCEVCQNIDRYAVHNISSFFVPTLQIWDRSMFTIQIV